MALTPRTLNISQANVDNASIKRVQIVRYDTRSGDVKNQSTDAADELNKYVEANGKKAETLNERIDTLIEAVRTIPGGINAKLEGISAAAGAESSASASAGARHRLAQSLTTQRTLHLIEDQNIGQFERLIRSSLNQTGETVRVFNEMFVNLGRTLSNWGNVTSVVRNKFELYGKMAATNLGTFGDALRDLLPAGLNWGDNLTDTMNLMNSAIEKGFVPLVGRFGDTVTDVAQTVREARNNFISNQGFDFYQYMGFKEANESIVALYDVQRRSSMMADIHSSQTQMAMSRQLNFMDVISQNTGLTVQKLVKLNESTRKELANLEAAGILTDPRQREGYERMITWLEGQGRKTQADIIRGVARAGGSLEVYLGQHPELTQGLVAQDQVGPLQSMIQLAESGAGMGDKEYAQAIEDITRQAAGNLRDFGVTGGAGLFSEQAIELFGELNTARTTVRDEERESTMFRFYNSMQDFFRNVFPTETGLLIAALSMNTLALISNRNSMIAGGSFLKGILGGGGGKMGFLRRAGIGGLMGGIVGGGLGMDPLTSVLAGVGVAGGGSLLGRLLGRGGAGAAAATVAPAAGGAIEGLAKAGAKRGFFSFLKRIPILGSILSLGLAAGSAFAGDWSGAGLELASGAANLVPGIGTAASIGIDAINASRGMVGPDPSVVSPTMPSMSGTDDPFMIDQIMRQTAALERLVALMTEGNETNENILDSVSGTKSPSSSDAARTQAAFRRVTQELSLWSD